MVGKNKSNFIIRKPKCGLYDLFNYWICNQLIFIEIRDVIGIYNTQCLIHDRIINVYDLNLFKYNELFEEAASVYDFELVQRVFRYTRDYVRKHKADIYDIYDFFKKAFNKNLEVMEHYDERLANWQQMFEEMMREFENNKMEKANEEHDEWEVLLTLANPHM